MAESLSPESIVRTAIGPFLGVLLGFGLERLYSWWSNRRSRRGLLRGAKLELEMGKKRLDEQKGKLIQTDAWQSAIYSGQAMLLRQEIRSRIGQVYFAVDNHNLEAKRVFAVGEEARQSTSTDAQGHVTFNQAKMEEWTKRSKMLMEEETGLSAAIQGLLNDSFWTDDC